MRVEEAWYIMALEVSDHHLNKLTQIYYWYQVGSQFMPVISFFLLCITASTNIQLYLGKYIDIPTVPLIAVMVICGFSGVFALGCFLDIILRYPYRQIRIGNQRNQMLMDIDERTKRIEEAMKK